MPSSRPTSTGGISRLSIGPYLSQTYSSSSLPLGLTQGQSPLLLSYPPYHQDRSLTATRGLDVLEKYGEQYKKRAKLLRVNIALCFGCVVTSTVIVVMEAFCLMALQFCDGEDLISLYWSTWTMIQVGSLIAMVGIILALVNSLQDKRHP